MPTRKQRRRRDKTFRHEYDLVVYDEEGNEVPVDTAELRAAKGKDKGKKPAARGGGGRRRQDDPRGAAAVVEPRAAARRDHGRHPGGDHGRVPERAAGARARLRRGARSRSRTGSTASRTAATCAAAASRRLGRADAARSSTTSSLSEFQSNCYVVRADRTAAEAAVIDPGGDPAALRLELARMGTRTAAILVTHTDIDHIAGVADLAEGDGRRGVGAGRRDRGAARRASRAGGAIVRAYEPEHAVAGGDEIAVAGLSSRSSTSRALGGPRRLRHRRDDLLRRPALRRLGRPRRPARRRLGHAARVGAPARRPLRPRRRRPSGPRPGDDARPRARHEPVPARAPRRGE